MFVLASEDLSCRLAEGDAKANYFLKPNHSINEPRHFVYPSSLNNNDSSCFERLKRYLPITPQTPLLTSRSLHQHIATTTKNKTTTSMTDEEIDNLLTDESCLLSMWSAGFTIINIYLGLGLLSYPYAIYQGGLISFVILAISCIFMSWTGKLLVRCFVRMRATKRTYPDVGYASFGKYGLVLISFGIIFEFFGGLCAAFIFMWQNTQFFVDSVESYNNDNVLMIALVCCIAVLPTIWILNLAQLSFISLLGSICKILTVVTIVLCFILNIHSVKDNISDDKLSMYPLDLQSLSICMGIFILSFAGHPVLPTVYNSMKEPERFEALLDRCFVCLFVIYCVMGFCGYLQFAQNTNVIITQNLIKMNDANGIELVVSQVLVLFIIFGIYFQISPLLSLVVEIPEMIIFNIKSKLMQRIFRTLSFVFCAVFSYKIMNHLAILEAITGSLCTMITSVISPSLFYFAIYTNYITDNQRVILILSALFGVVCGLFLLFNDIRSLIH